jgi:hypothetical protein
MSEDAIQKIWDEGEGKVVKTREEIEAYLQSRFHRQAFFMPLFIYLNLGVLAVTLVLEILNILGYQDNPTMLAVQSGVTVITVAFIAYGVHLLRYLVGMEQVDEPLLARLERRKRFFKTRYEIWMWIMSAGGLLLIFAVNTMMDNQNGQYRVNRPGFFTGIHAVMLLAMYLFLKMSHHPLTRQWKAVQRDLENQITDHTEYVERLQRTWWLFGSIALAIVFLLLFLWGLLQE